MISLESYMSFINIDIQVILLECTDVYTIVTSHKQWLLWHVSGCLVDGKKWLVHLLLFIRCTASKHVQHFLLFINTIISKIVFHGDTFHRWVSRFENLSYMRFMINVYRILVYISYIYMLEPPEAIVHATLSSLSSGRLGIFGLVRTKILQKKFLYVLNSRNIYRMVISIKMQVITKNTNWVVKKDNSYYLYTLKGIISSLSLSKKSIILNLTQVLIIFFR